MEFYNLLLVYELSFNEYSFTNELMLISLIVWLYPTTICTYCYKFKITFKFKILHFIFDIFITLFEILQLIQIFF